ncbi:hypothetical protein GMSM_29580 [Geomonas sp. Red276]
MKSKVIICFAILTLCVGGITCATADEIGNRFDGGVQNAKSGYIDLAITDFEEVIKLTENDVNRFFSSKGRMMVTEGNTFNERILSANVRAHEYLGKLYIRKSNKAKNKKVYNKGLKEVSIACTRGSSAACSYKDELNYSKKVEHFDIMKKQLRDGSGKPAKNSDTKSPEYKKHISIMADGFEVGRQNFIVGEYDDAIKGLDLLRRWALDYPKEGEIVFQRSTKIISYCYLYKYMSTHNPNYLDLADTYMNMSCKQGDKWSCKEIKIGILNAAHKKDFLTSDPQYTFRSDGILNLGEREISHDTSVLLLNAELQEILGKKPDVVVLVNNNEYVDGKCVREAVTYNPNGEGASEQSNYCKNLKKRYKQ